MRTIQRLDQAYRNAKVEVIDDGSKYVIISDCHRGNGNLSDEFTKNQNTFLYAMDFYYDHGYVLIEAGDGDELWEHPKFKDVRNAHHEAFEAILRFFDEGRFILLYGNHNIYLNDIKYVEKNIHRHIDDYTGEVNDSFEGLTPVESVVLKHQETGQEILVVHGHQGDAPNDQFWFLTMVSLKYFWRFLHSAGFQNPSSPVSNENKRHKIEKNYVKWIEARQKMLICGHTHRLKYPREKELPYFNTGCCIYPTSMTALEIEFGKVRIVRWWVKSNMDGILQVVRTVVRGPDPLEKFDIRKRSVKEDALNLIRNVVKSDENR